MVVVTGAPDARSSILRAFPPGVREIAENRDSGDGRRATAASGLVGGGALHSQAVNSIENPGDFAYADIWERIAAEAPDRIAVVCGDRRLSFGAFDERANRLANVLTDAGLRPGDKVAIELVNGLEYLETFYAALKLGCVPVNVNYRYVDTELAYLLDNADARALVFHDDFSATVATALAQLADPPPVLLCVERGVARSTGTVTGTASLTVPGARAYEEVLAEAASTRPHTGHTPSGDDLIFVYTGGTTGMPKAVMWQNRELYLSLWQSARPGKTPIDPLDAVRAGKRAITTLPCSPLMHGTSLFMSMSALSGGGTVVLIDAPGLQPEAVWDAVAREHVGMLAIVGDAFARPLLGALDDHPGRWDLSSVKVIMSSGVMWSPETKRGLLDRLPGIQLIDSLGSTEGIMSRNVSTGADATIGRARFAVSQTMRVLADDPATGALTEVEPGSGVVGMVAVVGHVPLGYWKDPAKSAVTFREFNGKRHSIPGDLATVEADGSITLLGRGSACINTGGEKVYPEEVEEIVKSHPAVFDCVCVGVPDERWGEMVVALYTLRDGTAAPPVEELDAFCKDRMAGYKRPKRYLPVASLDRSPAGKADHRRLRALAADLVGLG
jgi:3-oxocholest-4-en-26-oate---CoA ligase